MRRPLSLVAIASLVAGLTLVVAPAANAAPTLDPSTQRFADFTFTVSSTTDLVDGQEVDLTITKPVGGEPLCANFDVDSSTWVEVPNESPVILFLALYAVDGDTYTLIDEREAFNSIPYQTGAESLTVALDLEQPSVPGPFVAYAICQSQSGDRQFSGEGAETELTFTPFTFTPAQTPAGSTTTLSIPRPDLFCNIDADPAGHSVVLFFASTAEDLWNGGDSFFTWPTGWEEEAPGFGSFDPSDSDTIQVAVPLPGDIAEGQYWVSIICVGPFDGEFYPEAGSARYFGTLTIGPLADDDEPGAPTLPDTGAGDSVGIALVATGLLAAGLLLVMRGRRTSSA